MSMTKKDFIALANVIRGEVYLQDCEPFTKKQIQALANFCYDQNPNFNAERWLAYIAGECGPNGGAIKKAEG